MRLSDLVVTLFGIHFILARQMKEYFLLLLSLRNPRKEKEEIMSETLIGREERRNLDESSVGFKRTLRGLTMICFSL